jgi:hypothetical protein
MKIFEKFGRIFGAKRQKPGFPLQVLGFAHANPAGFPLQSLAHAQRQRKIASQFRGPGSKSYKRNCLLLAWWRQPVGDKDKHSA